MDPDENLREMKKLAQRIQHWRGITTLAGDLDDAERLAELVLALDGWISKGGFLPQDWQQKK